MTATTAGPPAPPGTGASGTRTGRRAALRAAASRVLLANWTGTSTVPSHTLYPHQWSWDSAFIAVGLSRLSPRRAQRELETLLGAQWDDGRIPHIVFNPAVPLDAYFPSPDFWRSSTAGATAGAPPDIETSGIVQPPVHALAAWLVHESDPETSGRRGFLERVYPRLTAWHRYLHTNRDLGGAGLASVLHPWEPGMDNSPCWDRPLERVDPAPAASFRRADLTHGDAADRPTDLDYGRYVRLATDYRERGYADTDSNADVDTGTDVGTRAPHGFVVEDPGFNAFLIVSEHALAAIALTLGQEPRPHRERARALTTALVERLWHPEAGLFLCRDLRTGTPIEEKSVAGLLPLLVPDLPDDVVEALLRTASGEHFGLGSTTALAPSYDLRGRSFDSSRYWRGPAWFNINWAVERGLRQHGALARADDLRHAILSSAGASGFAEYVDPRTGRARGTTDFSWTAAVVLDLLARTEEPGEGGDR
ncbi:hypothetical protein OG292_37045 [Streptomyces sp. NBC_01511]|uniref:MGH1-like glycoside hydrolase domain-containing protein n=1 Tax=Streptomyces sp. NBC_01511 TaxID=2903889 RepID=UPI00386838A9